MFFYLCIMINYIMYRKLFLLFKDLLQDSIIFERLLIKINGFFFFVIEKDLKEKKDKENKEEKKLILVEYRRLYS